MPQAYSGGVHKASLFLAVLLLGMFSFLSCESEDTSEEPVNKNASYTVSFDVNGGTGDTSALKSVTVKAGTIISLPVVDDGSSPLLTHDEGKMFVAWNTVSDGHGTGYSDGTSLVVTRNITLYAQWAVPHTVTFSSNGGSGTTCTMTVPEDISIKLPESSFSKAGKVLAEWNTNSSGSGTSYTPDGAATFSGDTTLYAIWKSPCTVSFNTNGGSYIEDQIVAEGYRAKKPASPEKAGYRFMGWYSDSSLGNTFDFETQITTNIELFASWKKVITVSYDSNGGDGEIQSQTLLEGEEVTLRENAFTRTDYGFACWNTSKDGSGDRYDDKAAFIPQDSMTLYAQWGMTCTVSFNKGNDNAEGEMEEISVPAGSSVQLPASTFALEGCYCSGWNTAPDGSGTSYTNGQTLILNETLTLYAQWKEGSGIFYSVTVPSVEHGTVTSNMTSAMAGSFVTLTVTPDENYKIGTITVTCGGENLPLTEVEEGKAWQFAMPDGEISVSIEFAVKGYRILADENTVNGTFSTEKEYYLPGEEVAVSLVPEETYAYRADSLTVKDSAGEEIELTEQNGENGIYYTFTMPEEDVTAYAEFDKLQCKVKFASSITGCDDMPSETSVDMGTQIILPSCTYFYYGTGYTFRNWNAESTGSGTAYTAGTSFVVNDDVTFWAQCDSGYTTTVSNLSTLLGNIKKHSLTSAKIIITDAKTSDVTGSTASSISPVGQNLASYSSVKVALTLNQNANLTSIGNYAFYYRSNLTSVSMPSNITSIGDYAFYNCSGLSGITIPGSVTSIGTYAFRYCSSLSSLSFAYPYNISSAGTGAFRDCTSLTSVYIPSGIKTIADEMFCGCTKLNNVSYSGTATVCIGRGAFSGCTKLPEIFIPETVQRIDEDAFSGCTGATKIIFNNSTPKLTVISNGAFKNCSSLTSVTIPSTITKISDYTFDGCTAAVFTIPASVTVIGNYSFRNCNRIARTTIPNSVTSIGNYAFAGCAYPEVTYIEIPSSVKTIGDYAFSNCKYIKYVSIPNSVTSIGKYAFYNSTNVQSITFDDNSKTETIGECAFKNCQNVSNITVPDSVKTIGLGAFSGIISLKTLSLPFVGSSSSKTSYDNTTYFGYIFGKDSYTGGSEAAQYYNWEYFSYSSAQRFYIPDTLKNVTIRNGTIWDGAFSGCLKIQSIDLGSGVTEIKDGAFYACAAMTYMKIPSTVTKIGSAVFGCCSGLKTLILPYLGSSSSTTMYFGNLFSAKNSSVTGTNSSDFTKTTQGSYSYYVPNALTDVTINGSSIQSSAFQNCKYLTYVRLPNVTSIPSYAFEGCEKLNINTTLSNSKTTSIGTYAFSGCNKTSDLTVPTTVQTIERGAFAGCTSLQTVDLPFTGKGKNAVQDNAENLFGWIFGTASCEDCTLTEQTYGKTIKSYIPDSILRVTIRGYAEYGAFENCVRVGSITYTKAQTEIPPMLCFNCNYLSNFTFPSGVTKIGADAFNSCKCLYSISIPDSVVMIRSYAFAGCSNLKTVSFGSGIKQIAAKVFNNCSSLSSVTFASPGNWKYLGTSSSDITNWENCTGGKTSSSLKKGNSASQNADALRLSKNVLDNYVYKFE